MRPSRWLPLILLIGVPAAAWMAGLFRDAPLQVVGEDGPIAGARVRFRGEHAVSVTDSQGHFSLARGHTHFGEISFAKEGYLIQSLPVSRLPEKISLERLSDDDRKDYAWVEPGPSPGGINNCVNCHPQIYEEWNRSAHAHSATNRHFLNIYDGSDWQGRPDSGWNLRADNPNGAGVCAACHAPTVSALGQAFEDIRQVRGVDRRGVHCDFCHKVAEATPDERGLTFGRFGFTQARPSRGQLFLGPLDDAERPGEAFSYSPLYRQSRVCAPCHEGVVFGVPVYTTFSEWLASSARREGKECQACHMAPSGRLSNIAPGKGGVERDPKTLAAHDLPGKRIDMLRRCLRLRIQLERRRGQVLVTAEVRAEHVGHRVPTGFIDRNLILVVEAFDEEGKRVPLESGLRLPGWAGGNLEGKAGRVYAKQYLHKSRREPIPFWRPDGRLVDTRLEPGRPDRRVFVFTKAARRVHARLIYRRFWQAVAETKGWPENEVTVVDWSGK